MIVRPRPSTLGLLVTLSGSILPLIAPRLLVVAVISVALTVLHVWRPLVMPDVSVAPFTLVGLALSIFLGFRNNACYDRWWEARKIWGQLLTDCRSLARNVSALMPGAPEPETVKRVLAFVHALGARLRGTDMAAAVGPWLEDADAAAAVAAVNPPDWILRLLAMEFSQGLGTGRISPIEYSILDGRIASLAAVQAGCERIRSTPIPFAYSLLLHRTAWLFCLLLPVGLVGTAGLVSPVIAVIVAYAFFGLDALGDELEEPFALKPNTIPIDAMTRTIERELLQGIGETNLPPALEPVGDVLS
jgi:putative membrane protein